MKYVQNNEFERLKSLYKSVKPPKFPPLWGNHCYNASVFPIYFIYFNRLDHIQYIPSVFVAYCKSLYVKCL